MLMDLGWLMLADRLWFISRMGIGNENGMLEWKIWIRT